jgi:hypothetical protein
MLLSPSVHCTVALDHLAASGPSLAKTLSKEGVLMLGRDTRFFKFVAHRLYSLPLNAALCGC